MTGIGQVAFPDAADGSPSKRDGKVVGSKLIGQDFSRPGKTRARLDRYFQSRPSVTGYSAERDVLQQPGPNQADLADLLQRRNLLDYLQRERPVRPGPAARARSRPTR